MALLNSYQDANTGLALENGYYKARKDIIVQTSTVSFSCDVYASEQARKDGKNPLASIEYSINTDIQISTDEDLRAKQLYGLLKTLPEFENSIDC